MTDPYGQTPSQEYQRAQQYVQTPPQDAPSPVQVFIQQGQPISGFATTSMILGIVGFVVACCDFGILSILAVIFGHLALHEIKNSQKAGRGMAVAGLVLGYIVLLPAVILSIWVIAGGGLAALTAGTAAS